jgi:GAF domain-containing protein
MILGTNIARMFAALSATNEAILRATSEDELFQRVCDAAVFGGKLLGTGVLLAEPGNHLRFVAGAGAGIDLLRGTISSTDEHSDEGHGLAASAFRAGRSFVTNDYINDDRLRRWHVEARRIGARSAAVVLAQTRSSDQRVPRCHLETSILLGSNNSRGSGYGRHGVSNR